MSETVTIRLDRRRPYRARQEDRHALWVGPGTVEVPRWVAEAWGIQAEVAVGPEKDVTPAPEPVENAITLPPPAPPPDAERDAPAQPWPAYDTHGAAQIIQRIPELSKTERAILKAYEHARKGRKTVLDALVQAEGE